MGNQLENKQSAQKAILPPKPKQIKLNCPNFKKNNFRSKLSGKSNAAQSLQRALVLQRNKILAKNGGKKKIKRGNNQKNGKKVNTKRNPFQQELASRVQNPRLKESWHILKARKVEDPHAAAIRKLCKEMMIAKSHLKHVPSPDCKTIIVLD